jgi:UDP-N-acetylglucosamine acyltransferase
MPSIHPSAHVSPGAALAEDVIVDLGAVIEDGVTIGAGSRVGHYAVLLPGTTVGQRVRIEAGAVLGGVPQDLKYHGGESGVSIGDRTVIREYVTVHRCVEPGAVTRVGADCMLMATSHVAHECIVGDRVMVANGVTLAGHVTVGDGAFISGSVIVHQFTQVGKLVMVGGASAVRQDLIPFCLADGHPARPMGLNRVGLQRAGFGPEQMRTLRAAYRILFRSGLGLAEGLERLEALTGEGAGLVGEIVALIKRSERGIARPRSQA